MMGLAQMVGEIRTHRLYIVEFLTHRLRFVLSKAGCQLQAVNIVKS